MKLRNIFFILLIFYGWFAKSQTQTIYIKPWIKEKEVLLRWVPVSKIIFDAGVKNGYKITRTDNSGNTVVIAEAVKPYAKEDEVWNSLLKTKDGAALAVGVLYDIISTASDPKKKQEQQMMVYNMMLLSCNFDADIAKACGLFFADKNIDNSKTYTYKISINTLPQTTSLQINAAQLSKHPEIKNLNGLFRNKNVKLRWKASEFRNNFSAYNIERSDDSINYSVINKSPIILLASEFEKNKDNIYYLDTFPKTKQKYYYRIKGVNHFGEWSEPSNVVSGIGYEPLRSFPVFDTIYTVKNLTVYMRWRMADKKESSYPKHYFISRAIKDAGPYEIIHQSNTSFDFTDEHPKPVNFYKVGAISYGGDTLESYSHMALINDTIPPLPPTGLKAKVDAKGNVTLTWDKNAELDVQGYKIFRSNALHEEFVQINNEFAREPKYQDKLNLKTLSKKVYYCVNATDKRYNNSELSKPVEVKRPDTIAPEKPIINNLQLKPKGILIEWINSNSEDVKYYVLYRQSENSQTEEKLKEWQAKDTLKSYLDTNLMMGTGYRYKLVVGDEDDNISISNNPYMRYETGYRKKLTTVKYSVNRTAKTVTLNWEYNYPKSEIDKYIIYRCKKGGALTIIKTLPGSANSFVDKTLFMGNIYEYRIKPVFTSGAEGIISDGVEVEY